MYHLTALVTCLATAFYFFTSARLARAHIAYGVKLPAMTGHPDFERVFRVQMNTLEWMPIFLPSLWLFAIYISDPIAAEKRSMGFGIQASAAITLWAGALGAIVWRMVHA